MRLNKVARYGKPVVIRVYARDMHKLGYKFYKTENNVWLTNFVPNNYMTFED